MQIPLGDLHASAISLLAHINLLGVSVPDVWKKRTQGTPASAPESPVSVSERVSTSAGDERSLDDVIATVKAAANDDACCDEILAAAITLRDSSGRDRKDALRKMANAWGVTVNEKVGGKYKPRPNSALAEDIQAAVCQAALDWESRAQPSQGSDKKELSRDPTQRLF